MMNDKLTTKLKLHKISTPTQKKGFLSRMKQKIESVAETTSNIVQKINQKVVQPVVEKVVTVKNNIVESVVEVKELALEAISPRDLNKEWVLLKLGKNEEAKNFYNFKLSALNLSSLEIRNFIESLFKFKHFTATFIFELEKEDLKVLYKMVKLGNIQGLSGYEIYEKLDFDIQKRIDYWFHQAYVCELKLSLFNFPLSGTSINYFDLIAKHYIKESAKNFKKENMKYIRLIEFLLVVYTGNIFISLKTVRMSIIWYCMLYTLTDNIKPSSNLTMDPISLSCIAFFELVIHICAYELKRKVDMATRYMNIAFDSLSPNLQAQILDKLGIDLTDEENYKIHCWNKTLSVLSGIPRLTEEQGGRMLLTYALAITYKDTVALNLELKKMFKGLSPVPTEYTIYEILEFYRDSEEFNRRKENVFIAKEKEIARMKELFRSMNSDKKVVLRNLIHLSYITYISILRLKIAFCPAYYYSDSKGGFINPVQIPTDKDLIQEISEKQHLKGRNLLTDDKNLELHVKYLTEEVGMNHVEKFIDFFGKPKNIQFNVVRQNSFFKHN